MPLDTYQVENNPHSPQIEVGNIKLVRYNELTPILQCPPTPTRGPRAGHITARSASEMV